MEINWTKEKDRLLKDVYADTTDAREALTDGHGTDKAYWRLVVARMHQEGIDGSGEAFRKRYAALSTPTEAKPTKSTPVAVPGKHYRVGRYCILRCREAGVHAGIIEDYDPMSGDARVSQCRRLWRWDSQFTLSELAEIGVRNASNCKFSVPVSDTTICGVCELLACTDAARESIEGVKNANT